MKIIHYYFLIALNEFFSLNNQFYRIPFGLFKQQNPYIEKKNHIVHNIINNGKYINLSIGTPLQIIPFELDSKSQTFSASYELYNRNISSTYKQISSKETKFNCEDAEKGFNSEDILKIDNKTTKEIRFILGTKYNNLKYNNLGIIGLHIPNFVQYNIYPFFKSLKFAGLINSFIWTLKFFDNISLINQISYNEENDNIIGEFIFGAEPSKYENDKYKYNETNYYKINPIKAKENIDWDIEFNNIYIKTKNNKKIFFLGEKLAKIVINFSYMLCPNYFFDFIKSNFFKDYLLNHICDVKIMDFVYEYIQCEYNSAFRVDSFPVIAFEHKDFDTTFNLTYKDLFITDKKNNKYIFLLFTKAYFNNWILGTIFLRKFQFVFDEDLKTIGFYKSNLNLFEDNNQKNLLDVNNSNIIKSFFIFIFMIIFSFLLIFFGMVIQRKYFNKNRKIRANELEENFSYEIKNSNENNKEINNNKKIIEEDYEKEAYFSL